MATNIRFQGLVKTTAEIESDKFAGRIGWNTTLARFVAYYNSTQYAQMARRDVLETFAAGIQDSTLGVGLPMFAGTAGRLSTESVANFRSRIGAVNKAGDTMTGALTLSAGNLNVNAGAIQTAGVTRISNGGAGTLTTLSTTGLADLASARVQNLTASQMVATDGSKNLVSWDAATARTNLGIVGADRINRSLKSATASGWCKLATVKATAVGHASTFFVEVVSSGRSTGTTDSQRVRLYVRLKQNSAMSSPIDIMQARYTSEGDSSFSLGYVVEQDDATEKRVSIYVGANSSTHYMRYSVLASFGSTPAIEPVFFEDPTPLASQPTPWVDATPGMLRAGGVTADSYKTADGVERISAGGAGALTTLVTTGLATLQNINIPGLTASRMLSLDASKNVQALDAAGSRALIGAGTSDLALGETSSTAYRGDRGKTAYDHSQATGNLHGTTYAQLASIPAALDAIDGLTPAADRIAYYTGANSAALATLSSFGRSLIDDADQAAARATLGLDGKVLWRDQAKDGSGFSGGWNSLLSASATKRKFAANTWAAGDCLEFEYIGVLNLIAKTLVFEWWLGPNDSTFTGSYYVVVGPSSWALGSGYNYFRLRVVLSCISAGASGAFRYAYEIAHSDSSDLSKTTDWMDMKYDSGQVTTTDTTVDTYFDFACSGLNTGDLMKGIMSKATLNKNV